MSGINPEKFTLQGHTLTIVKQQGTQAVSGSTRMDPSFIKERLGFFESAINRFYSLFSDNYWKEKTVTVETSNKTYSKTMFVLESRLNINFKPIDTNSKATSTQPAYAGYQLPSYIGGHKETTSHGSRTPDRPITPSKSDSLKSTSTSSATTSTYTREQMKRIHNANRLVNWLATLNRADCKIKPAGTHLSIEPKGGVVHDKITQPEFASDTQLLQCTFPLLTQLNPTLWSSKDDPTSKRLNYKRYIEACDASIKAICEKSIKSPDDEINLGLLTCAKSLAKGFEQILSGAKKDEHTFEYRGPDRKIITDYAIKFSEFEEGLPKK